jgi:hypothetical protein
LWGRKWSWEGVERVELVSGALKALFSSLAFFLGGVKFANQFKEKLNKLNPVS